MTVAVIGLIALAAMLYGLDKSLAPGAGILAMAMLASVMPAKEATGITLIMAIVADWSAIWAYRGNVSVRSLTRLFPFVAVGVICGVGFLFVADNDATRKTIGVILAVFVAMYFVSLARGRLSRRHSEQAGNGGGTTAGGGSGQGGSGQGVPESDDSVEHAGRSGSEGREPRASAPAASALAWGKRAICGALAGFTTMVANAGGPITAIYFLSENLTVMRFLGTTAWFYLIINLVKLPFSIGLGMITWANFLTMVWAIPLTLLAVLLGRWIAGRVSRNAFSVLVYALSVAAIVRLFL